MRMRVRDFGSVAAATVIVLSAAWVLFAMLLSTVPASAAFELSSDQHFSYDAALLAYDGSMDDAPGAAKLAEVAYVPTVQAGGATTRIAQAHSLSAAELVAPSQLVPGPNGAMRDPRTGQFAPDRVPEAPSSGVHGNSRNSEATTSLYQLYDADGNYLKTGVTANPAGRYSGTFMEDKFMDVINTGSRSNMLDLERRIV